MAADAGVKRLVLTHYSQDAARSSDLVDGAAAIYKGEISSPTTTTCSTVG